MARIYVSLPISGQDEQKQREHADLTKAMLSRAGQEVITPFDVYAGKGAIYPDYISADLRALWDCDTIYLCEGWQFSKGCTIEATYARIYGKQFMYERQDTNGDYYYR